MDLPRVVVWFSCGEASACALKLAVNKYGERVVPVYCDLSRSEEQDNERFMRDVELWVGRKISKIESKFYRTVDEVFEDTKYMSGIKGARCTVEMKKIPRFHFQNADDIHLFGFTADEPDRIEKFESKNPDMALEWILLDNGVTKADCRTMITSAGIATPKRYLQGFANNNCICCVKATSLNYWVMERRLNPVVFARRSDQSRRLGVRLVRYNGNRIFLDEMPKDEDIIFNGKPLRIERSTESISCGPECAQGEFNLFNP